MATIRRCGRDWDRRVGYVTAVSCDHRIPTNCGPVRADSVARGLPPVSRQRLSAGAGSKGQRMYSWAYLSLPSDEAGEQWILMRRTAPPKAANGSWCCQVGVGRPGSRLTLIREWARNNGHEVSERDASLGYSESVRRSALSVGALRAAT